MSRRATVGTAIVLAAALIVAAFVLRDSSDAAPSSDAGAIVFSYESESERACSGIYATDPEGTDLRQLIAANELAGTMHPLPSPNRHKLGFVSPDLDVDLEDEGYAAAWRVWVLDLESGRVSHQTNILVSLFTVPPFTWVDDRTLAIPRVVGRRVSYELRAVDGGVEGTFVEGSGSPAWTAGGRKAAFGRGKDDAPALHVGDRMGKASRRIGVGGGTPKWSPDGSRVAALGNKTEALRMIDVDSRAERVIARDVDGFTWAPDSQQVLAAVSGRSASGQAVVLDADGTNRNIVDNNLRPVAWAPDGKSFIGIREDDLHDLNGIYRVDLPSRRSKLIAALTDGHRNLGSFPLWVPAGPLAAAKEPMAPRADGRVCERELEAFVEHVRKSMGAGIDG